MTPAELQAEIHALRDALADEIARKKIWRELALAEGAQRRALEETVGVLLKDRP